MGAQSFDQRVLDALERVHGPAAVRRAFAAARAAGHTNVNLDLIYGANGETLTSWRRTLEETIALGPEHVSAYALTIEPATPLGRKVGAGLVPAPDPDLQADMFGLACELLGDAGYGHYEVSNWALPGFECRHNLGYWRLQPYLGLGAGAHSYRHGRRWWNVRPPAEYLDAVERGVRPVGGEERLRPEDERLETVFLKLRILEGVPVTSVATDVASGFLEQGLLRRREGHLVPTERGHAAAERAGPGPRRLVSRPRRDRGARHHKAVCAWRTMASRRSPVPGSPACRARRASRHVAT